MEFIGSVCLSVIRAIGYGGWHINIQDLGIAPIDKDQIIILLKPKPSWLGINNVPLALF